MRGLRMPPELEAAIDAWIERQPEPKPSRSEAIRRLIEMASSAKFLKPTTSSLKLKDSAAISESMEKVMPRTVVSLRITNDLMGELDRLAGDCRTTRSKLAERILAAFFEQGRVAQNVAIGRKGGTTNA